MHTPHFLENNPRLIRPFFDSVININTKLNLYCDNNDFQETIPRWLIGPE